MITTPVNQNAIREVKEVLAYFANIEGKGIITGQHTQTMEQEELAKIQEVTGKLPALCGFELLSPDYFYMALVLATWKQR